MKFNKINQRLYNTDIPIIAITGGIATGKSTVSTYLKKRGFLVICADSLIKEIYQMSETFDFIKSNYPKAITSNQINFKILREIVFNSKEDLTMVESFLYPHIKSKFTKKILPTSTVIFYDVPLLFEKEIDKEIDYSLCIACKQQVQIDRVMKRDSISKELALKIIEEQINISKKITLADYSIDNSSTKKSLLKDVDSFLQKMQHNLI